MSTQMQTPERLYTGRCRDCHATAWAHQHIAIWPTHKFNPEVAYRWTFTYGAAPSTVEAGA